VAGLTLMNNPPQPPQPPPPQPPPVGPQPSIGTLPADLSSAVGQVEALDQTVASLKALLQKLQAEAPQS
jgi:hypothetical protein